MLQHICSGCGCITSAKSYCPVCEKKRVARRWQSFQQKRRARGENIYNTKAWQVLRLTALERDRWLCQECLRQGIYTSATDVDHIVPRSLGGSDDLENLQSLCRDCHKRKTFEENRIVNKHQSN